MLKTLLLKSGVILVILYFPNLLNAQDADSVNIHRINDLLASSNTKITEKNFEEALKLNSQAYDLALKVGKETTTYADVCSSHGKICSNQKQFDEAEKYFIESKNIREKIFGKEGSYYATSLTELAQLYKNSGMNTEADSIFKELMTITIPEKDRLFQNRYLLFGGFYQDIRMWENAIDVYLKGLPVLENGDSLLYANCLQNLGQCHAVLGMTNEARDYCERALDIRRKIDDIHGMYYPRCLSMLAQLTRDAGDLITTETYILEALKSFEAIGGKYQWEYAMALWILSSCKSLNGDHEKSVEMCFEILDIFEKVVGKGDSMYGNVLNTIAAEYFAVGKYAEAEPIFLQSKELMLASRNMDQEAYAIFLMNMASNCLKLSKLDDAEKLYIEAKDFCEKNNLTNHITYGYVFMNTGTFYHEIKNYPAAEAQYEQARDILLTTIGKDHPHYINLLVNFIDVNWYSGDTADVKKYLLETNQIERNQLLLASKHLSEMELADYLYAYSEWQFTLHSLVQVMPEFSTLAYDNALFHKGFILNATSRIAKLAKQDATNAAKFEHCRVLSREMASLYSMPAALKDDVRIAELEREAETLQKELAKSISGYGEGIRQVRWQEVRENLSNGEAAIEFVHYELFNPTRTDSLMYAAILIRPENPAPLFIPLFEARELQKRMKESDTESVLYASRGITTSQMDDIENLYEIMWRPMEPMLKGIEKIYFSPTGILNRVNFNAIPTGDSQVLGDKYEFVQLGSTRQLVVAQQDQAVKNDAVLFGGLNYDNVDLSPSEIKETKASKIENDKIDVTGAILKPIKAWNFLPGTDREVTSIAQQLKAEKATVQLFMERDGSEEAFKQLGVIEASPYILHIATHGFFFPEQVSDATTAESQRYEDVFRASSQPMFRSGLVLSGANIAWQTGQPVAPGRDDGILTAYEISQMNLSNTELVVLSACETGLGDIDENEGVYGLQRAFKIAGVKYIIMSLWQVPDQQTTELMKIFYQNWIEQKMSLPEAFKIAQKTMREKYSDPNAWAGFVLVE